MPEAAQLLLVEDDRQLASMLEQILVGEGYDVDVARDGQRGLHLGLTRSYDVIVLDRGLPAIEGLDLLGRLRSKGVVTPALVLSALGNPADRVAGLDAGAEDYMSKPFDVDELAARLRALRRRTREHVGALHVPGGTLDVATRQVTTASGALVDLSERECSLLELLARHPRRCSAGPRSWTGCSRTRRTTAWWTRTSTTCAASSAGRPWRPCAARATGWAPDDHARHHRGRA